PRTPPPAISATRLAKMIDHALLHPALTATELGQGCALAAGCQVASVCVRPCDVATARRLLAGTGVLVGTVVGFPHGGVGTRAKVGEGRAAMADGAEEIDMVLNIGWLRSGDLAGVAEDIRAVVAAAGGVPVKVILENAYLTDAEKVAGCTAARDAGAAFVKTSTGFAPGGATVADVRLMRATVGPDVGVKASGGVRTPGFVAELLAAGATRIGTSATESILDGWPPHP
ncbi:MAG TPA: deoxyribose-phosphate aldolase, partial [Pilimelia sp.]|nr:deoxyribose-phosphate aldolase [Pilimelia sp.]